jgi:hypothetical protein
MLPNLNFGIVEVKVQKSCQSSKRDRACIYITPLQEMQRFVSAKIALTVWHTMSTKHLRSYENLTLDFRMFGYPKARKRFGNIFSTHRGS